MCGDMMIDLDSKKFESLCLGGTGVMYLVEVDGKEYIFKPAIRKRSSIKERSIVQECAYKIQMIVDPLSAVWCCYVEQDDIVGALQEKIPLNKKSLNYKDMQKYNISFSEGQLDQFMREFITDYLICNFDSHGGNFITDENGVIRGIDKEQAFKYMIDKESEFPSINYHPNEIYGEDEPIYNTIFRRFSNGELDIDFGVIDKYMKRVEMVDDREYASIFKSYCDQASHTFDMSRDEMLEKIVARKKNMRNVITTFYNSLSQMRKTGVESGKRIKI